MVSKQFYGMFGTDLLRRKDSRESCPSIAVLNLSNHFEDQRFDLAQTSLALIDLFSFFRH
jgi:hypothetical protein